MRKVSRERNRIATVECFRICAIEADAAELRAPGRRWAAAFAETERVCELVDCHRIEIGCAAGRTRRVVVVPCAGACIKCDRTAPPRKPGRLTPLFDGRLKAVGRGVDRVDIGLRKGIGSADIARPGEAAGPSDPGCGTRYTAGASIDDVTIGWHGWICYCHCGVRRGIVERFAPGPSHDAV